MKSWWSHRQPRERLLMFTCAAVLIAFAGLQGIVLPALHMREHAAAETVEALAYLQQVEQDAHTITELRRNTSAFEPIGPGGLRSAATSTAQSMDLEILRLQPIDNGSVEFWFEAVPATRVIEWIDTLNTRYGASVIKADLQRNRDDQTVRARVTLSLGPES